MNGPQIDQNFSGIKRFIQLVPFTRIFIFTGVRFALPGTILTPIFASHGFEPSETSFLKKYLAHCALEQSSLDFCDLKVPASLSLWVSFWSETKNSQSFLLELFLFDLFTKKKFYLVSTFTKRLLSSFLHIVHYFAISFSLSLSPTHSLSLPIFLWDNCYVPPSQGKFAKKFLFLYMTSHA